MPGYISCLYFVAFGITQDIVSTSRVEKWTDMSNCSETSKEVGVFTLTQLLLSLNWSSLCAFTDQRSNGVDALHRSLPEGGMFSITTFVTMGTDRARELVRVGILEKTENRLFIIISSPEYLGTILSIIIEVATERFLFYSKWLIITENYPSIKLTGRFENMALIIHEGMNKTLTQFTCEKRIETKFTRDSRVETQFTFDPRMDTLTVAEDKKCFSPVRIPGEMCGTPGNITSSPESFRKIIFPNPQSGLNGRTVKIGTAHWYPYVMKTENGSLYGYTIDLFNEMATILNFKPKYVEYPENGSEWIIMYDHLAKKDLDILSAPLIQTKERQLTMDFIFPADQFGQYYVFYKSPNETDAHWKVVLDTISGTVIALSLICLFCTTCLLTLFDKLLSYNEMLYSRAGVITSNRLWTYLWILFGNSLNQGHFSIIRQKSVCNRTVISAWCMFCLILSVTFTAYLVPALGVSKPIVLFKTIGDLLNNSDYKWGMYAQGSMLLKVLKTSQKRENRELYKGMEKFNQTDPEVLSSTVNQNVKRLLSEEYAFIENTLSMRLFSNECDITYIHDLIATLPSYYVTYKHSPLTDLFSETLNTLFEIGYTQRMKQSLTVNDTCGKERNLPVAAGMHHVFSTLILGTIGVTMATIALFCEIAWKGKFHSI